MLFTIPNWAGFFPSIKRIAFGQAILGCNRQPLSHHHSTLSAWRGLCDLWKKWRTKDQLPQRVCWSFYHTLSITFQQLQFCYVKGKCCCSVMVLKATTMSFKRRTVSAKKTEGWGPQILMKSVWFGCFKTDFTASKSLPSKLQLVSNLWVEPGRYSLV